MTGERPEQAILTKNTDFSKTQETRNVIENMIDGLNDHRIDDIGEFFSKDFRWMGNTGCGLKNGLKEFQEQDIQRFRKYFWRHYVRIYFLLITQNQQF